MLHVTSQARAVLHDRLMNVLAKQKQKPGVSDVGFRLMAHRDRLGLALDAPAEGDQVVEHEGRSVLIVEPEIAHALEGRTLDAVETADGTHLQLEARSDP